MGTTAAAGTRAARGDRWPAWRSPAPAGRPVPGAMVPAVQSGWRTTLAARVVPPCRIADEQPARRRTRSSARARWWRLLIRVFGARERTLGLGEGVAEAGAEGVGARERVVRARGSLGRTRIIRDADRGSLTGRGSRGSLTGRGSRGSLMALITHHGLRPDRFEPSSLTAAPVTAGWRSLRDVRRAPRRPRAWPSSGRATMWRIRRAASSRSGSAHDAPRMYGP